MWQNPQETADLVTFTEEILNEKLIFCVVTAISISYSLVAALTSFHCTRNKLFDKEFPHFLYSVRFWDSYPPVWFGTSPSFGTEWFATCARKPKVSGSSPVVSYVQRWALCSNAWLMCKYLWSRWKW